MIPAFFKFDRFFLLPINNLKEEIRCLPADKANAYVIKNLSSFLKKISSKYLLLITNDAEIKYTEESLQRLLLIAEIKPFGIIYSDYIEQKGEKLIPHPLIAYQSGSIRNDFSFGHVLLFSVAAIKNALRAYGTLPLDAHAGFYDLRLKISIDHVILHVPEFLYTVGKPNSTEQAKKNNQTEEHFSYVAAVNLRQQNKLEKVATNYLKLTNTYLSSRTKKAPRGSKLHMVEASIVIPVLNRIKTINDALVSALTQETDFDFNIIVVDNHSIDGTTELVKKIASKTPKVVLIIPSRWDLGIGGCWNEAINSTQCGRYTVQLDSDDLYSSPHTLQRIVDLLRKDQYAMLVGSYTIVNEKLEQIPPGLIDHREWTQANGHNNLLRVNGMGAPRAFVTEVIRDIGFPDVSYGEDYAVALRITREFKIGRIYESLYLCRRWQDNTDAGLSVEKQNRNDCYKDELRTMEIKARQEINKCSGLFKNLIFDKYPGKNKTHLPAICGKLFDTQKKNWPALNDSCRDLSSLRTRKINCGSYDIQLQFNPARAVSSGARTDAESIKKRPCFLCAENLPDGQHGILYRRDYLILCNPAPIFDHHFTIATLQHQPQEINSVLSALLKLAADLSPTYTVFYNGPACGASAPDHLHFQVIPISALSFLKSMKHFSFIKEVSSVKFYRAVDIDRCIIILEAEKIEAFRKQFKRFVNIIQNATAAANEPLMNIFCTFENDTWRLVAFLRQKHRPNAYFASGDKKIFVSPGAIDMAGLVITPRLNDFNCLDAETIRGIYREVSLSEEIMNEILNRI